MVDITLTVANEDLDTVEAFVSSSLERLGKQAVASAPNKRTDKATVLYVMLMGIRRQIKEHRALCRLKDEQERAARNQARKEKARNG